MRLAARPRPVSIAAVLAACILLALPAAPVDAQLRRDAPTQPLYEAEPGSLLLGLGAGFGSGASFPLSALEGDLLSLGVVDVAYAAGPRIVFGVRGAVHQRLLIRERGASRVPLDPDAEDGTVTDVGDFRLGVLAAPFGRLDGLHAGFRFEAKLPNSEERKGIGTNTTDVRTGILVGYGGGPIRITGDAGVAILEAPLGTFRQNDVVAYSAEAVHRLPGGRARLFAGVEGRANTRERVPVGTEDRGEARLGADLRVGGWLADTFLRLGYAGTAPDWGLSAGLSRELRF